jgi:hypothetical protein
MPQIVSNENCDRAPLVTISYHKFSHGYCRYPMQAIDTCLRSSYTRVTGQSGGMPAGPDAATCRCRTEAPGLA